MKIHKSALLAGFLTTFVAIATVDCRAVPDFYTDQDLSDWHEFGLKNFYGPWGVMSRKPNGNIISYADYGLPIPSDFHSISTITDGASQERSSIGLSNHDLDSILRESDEFALPKNIKGKRSVENLKVNDSASQTKRDILELIGIVGVIENDDNIAFSVS